jgi:predicted aconitase with swiveling domain
VLNDGAADGPVMHLDVPLSFWGAFDPATGTIIDVHHPQRGACLKDVILLMRESRGSGSAPGAIAEAIRHGTAPAAIVLVAPDINLAVGAAVAQELYGKACPVLAVDDGDFEVLAKAAALRIAAGGQITPA